MSGQTTLGEGGQAGGGIGRRAWTPLDGRFWTAEIISLLGQPLGVLRVGNHIDLHAHIKVSGSTNFVASQFINKIGVAGDLPHFFGGHRGGKVELGGHTGHHVHLDPKMRHVGRVNHIAGPQLHQYRAVDRKRDFRNQKVVLAGRIAFFDAHAVGGRNQSEIITAQFSIRTGVAGLPSKLVSKQFKLQGIFGGFHLGDLPPHFGTVQNQDRQNNRRYHCPVKFQLMVVGIKQSLAAFAVAVGQGKAKQQ